MSAISGTRREQLLATLSQRENELRGTLASEAAEIAATGDDAGGVRDFKDVAAAGSIAAIDAVQSMHAAAELEQVRTALLRLADGSYGACLDCGEPIDERRLLALPATPLCTGCQTLREQSA